MNEEYYIIDEPLPLNQDFKSLKEMGLSFIQNHVGSEWTNLNTSDPGITILDQLCYALTELGYCNSFPVKDILTGDSGKLKLINQFYLPEDILTTSPVTVSDYIKYIVDGVDGVNNAVIAQAVADNISISRAYQIYLLIDGGVKNKDEVCWDTYVYLNKSRNLGEFFLAPLALTPVAIYLKGGIQIENKWDLNSIILKINGVINDYIFPKISPTGYTKLIEDGNLTNEIFDGPRLRNGWIPTDSLVFKRTSINILEIIPLIESIKGVKSVTNFNYSDGSSYVTCLNNEILFIDAVSSIQRGYIEIKCDNETIQYELPNGGNILTDVTVEYEPNILFGASVEIQTDLPKGNFRDINTYYSIQNTFPAMYTVGPDSLVSNSTEYEIAQSKQLKGYLTLFDQVLANQFSQLANIEKLFSFENPITGTPSDRDLFYAKKDKYEKEHPGYPAPYLQFSPTYFYQSLYEIPYIKALLKDHDIFDFSEEEEPGKIMEQRSWEKYKQDPYNAYIRGLMECMEDENTALGRRNKILDHLLARHGESPLMINAYINGSYYTKNTLKDKVIFKSLYLQNLGLLSYFRYKAYNFTAANKIAGIGNETEHPPLEDYEKCKKKPEEDDSTDFIFNSRKVDRIEKLKEQDFVNYSGIELKLNLLFGFKKIYSDFLESIDMEQRGVGGSENVIDKSETQKQATWFIEHRKGAIMIEMELLYQYFNFEIALTDTNSNETWLNSVPINYKTLKEITGTLSTMSKSDIVNFISTSPYKFNASNLKATSANYTSVPGTECSYVVKVIPPTPSGVSVQLVNFNTDIEFFYPEFVDMFKSVEFGNRFNFFLKNELPVYLSCNFHVLESDVINPFVNAFVDWHNSLRCTDIKHYPNSNTIYFAWNLLVQIINVHTVSTK